jgi:chromosome partitioning protein
MVQKILAITNQKGGVGKTTTSVNLAASLTATKRKIKVLLVDMDPQGNATMGSGVDKYELEHSVYDVLVGKKTADEVIVYAETAGFHVLPSNDDLTVAEVELMDKLAREQYLKKALAKIKDQFDYILIDCPPSLNLLTLNALVAADGVLIPMQCEYYALEGLTALLNTIEDVRSTVNKDLEIFGLVRTMFDGRNNLSTEVSEQLIEHFGDKVFRTVIPRNIRLAEAPSFGVPAIQHDKTSHGARAYMALAGEMLRKKHKNK